MRFIKIPRTFLNLKEGTKFIDVLVYAAIALHTDSETGKARIGMRTIAEKYNITLLKVEQSVERLKKNGYINYIKLLSFNNDYVFNEYTFPEIKDFLMLKPELLTEDLKPKDRGILIYLQLACEYKSNTITETTLEGLANRIGITRQTMSKYYKAFEKEGYMWKDLYYHTKMLVGGCEKINTKEMRQGKYEIIL
jgi:DNA-binding MarR family transcriptional regulator